MNYRISKPLLAFLLIAAILSGCSLKKNEAAQEAESAQANTPPTGAKQTADYELVVTPESDTIAPGMKYRALITVNNLNDSVYPEFMGSGQLVMREDGISANFTVQTSGGFEKGETEKEEKYLVKVKISNEKGEVATRTHEGKFIVKKSSLTVTPGPAKPLFTEVGHTITLDAPDFGDQFNPQISISGGNLIPITYPQKKVIIVPKPRSKKVVIQVKNNANGLLNDVGEVAWEIVDPPAPQFKLVVNGSEYDGKSAIPKKGTAALKIVPDREFQTQFPKDARYIMTAAIVKSGSKPLGQKSGIGKDATRGVEVDLSALKDLNTGDEITFEVSGLKRINFQNKQVEEKGDFTVRAKVK